MLRNHTRLLAALGAAFLAAAPALHAQQSGQPVRGDVDGDGRVTAADARIVSDWLVGRPVPPGSDVAVRGDVNGDGRVTAVDAAIIARAAAGRDVSRFPVGKELPAGAVAVVECTGSLQTSTVSCGEPGTAGGGRRDLIVGGQNVNVKLTSANIAKVAPDTFQFTVTVQNLLPQAMAVDSGTGTPNANGVRVFFASGPNVTGGTGTISVANPDGMGTFLAANQRYFQYAAADLGDGVLAPQEISSQRTWKLQYTGSPTFSFLLYLSTPVQFPAGWVDIYPPSHAPSPTAVYADTMQPGATLQLQDTVRNGFGGVIPGPSVTWSNTANGHATVNGTGLVTASTAGVDTVTATNGPRSGRVAIVVAGLSADSTTITANPTSIAANDTSLITVQVRDEFGHNITTGGATVTLTTNLGTLKGTTTATTVTAVDQGNGTYTAKLTGTTVGTATITGTLNGNPIGDNTTTVTIGPSTPATLSIAAGDGQSALVGSPVATAPKVHVADAYGNSVPGVTINFSVTGGGGSTTGASPVTGATGDASIGSWTLGSGPALNTLQAAATPAGTTTPVTFTGYVPPNAVSDSSQAMGNTTLPSSVTPNTLTNDNTINGGAVSLVPASIGALATARSGTLNLAADGSFNYVPPAGITGRDSVAYTVKDTHYTGPASASSTSYIKLRFVGKVWYVDGSGPNGDGRDTSPFSSIANAELAAGVGVNDSLLVRPGTVAGGTLKNGQLVYGAGASSAFTTTLNGNSVTLLATGAAPSIGALTLGSGNTLRGFAGTGTITGSGFGTLTVSEVSLNTGAAQALSLTTGTLSGGFTSLTSSGGTNNVLLSGVSSTGSTLGASGNALSGASGDGVVISNGSGSFTFPGNVSNGNSFAVNVNGKSGGTVTFSGNINPGGAARGISVANNTGGSVVFSGGTKAISSGTAAGVTLTNNTGATIQFSNGGLTIATTTGAPFTATGGGTVEVTKDAGTDNTISATGAAANAANLSGITLGAGGMSFLSISSSGTTTGTAFSATSVGNTSGSSFTAGSLTVAGTSAGANRGLAISSSSAPFTFTTVSINGTGGEGIYLNGNTGAVNVNGGTVGNTSNPTGDALAVSGGSAAVTVAASLTKSSAGRIANIGSHTAGNVTVSGTLSCTASCTGINVASNSGGTIDFSAGTKTINTGANAAVTLSSNTGATVNFSNGGLAITTTSGGGYSATGGGTVNVTGSNNTVSTAGGVGVNIQNTTIGASNVTFKSVNKSTGSAFGIRVENTGASGGLKVTGDGSTANSGGILAQTATTATDSAGVTLTGTTALDLQFMKVNITTGSGASGIVASNLTGSNQVAKTSIDYNNTAPDAVPAHGAYGARLVQTSSNATMTFDAVSIANKLDGTTAGSLSAGGSATVTFNVIDSNTGDSFNSNLSGLFGSGWVISSGDTGGSTGTVNVTISDTKFLNAAANGTNNLELGANASSTMNYKIKNNTFSAVANASFIAGIMNIQSFDTAVMGGTTAMDSITGNTITNSGTSAAVANLGYIGIRVALQSASATTHRVVINNNQITDLWRQGVLISTRQNATGHFKLTNNVIGTAALPVGQSNRRGLETDLQDNSVMNLEMTGNSFFNSGTSDSNAAVGLRVGTNSGSATLNATVVSNTIANSSAGTTARFRAESAATGTGTLCLDLRTNSLDAATKTFGLLQTGGTFRVEAAGTGAVTNAQIQSANTVGTGNVSGTITNNNSANCAQPPI